MKTIRIAFAVVAIAAVGIAQEAAAQKKGELDVTMRVLDDVRGIDAVIVAIGGASDETAAREEGKAHSERAPADAAPADAKGSAHEAHADDLHDDALEPADEDHVEGALEDHDRAKDLEPVEPPH